MNLNPSSVVDIQTHVLEHDAIRIVGNDSHSDFRLPSADSEVGLNLSSYAGIINLQPADQVVEVKAGTTLAELQDCLGKVGQCLPILGGIGTVGGAYMLNLPHNLEYEFGNWRDWILGARFVLADGTDVKAGSHVVKSVAGYDLHRFMVGTRGSLAICTELTLRTFPVKAVGVPDLVTKKADEAPGSSTWIQRVPLNMFSEAWNALSGIHAEADAKTGTIWAFLNSNQELPRYPADWVMRSGCGEKNIELTDATQIKLMKRAKEVFDPAHKLNPGEWGFM